MKFKLSLILCLFSLASLFLVLSTSFAYAQKLNRKDQNQEKNPINPQSIQQNQDHTQSKNQVNAEGFVPSNTAIQSNPEALSADEIYNRYAQGKNAYLYGNYPQCVEKLSTILMPNILIVDTDQRIDAYRYLGLSLYYLKNSEQSQSIFEKLLFLKPDYELDPVETPQEAISFFDKIKKDLQTQLIERQKILEEERKKEEEKRKKLNAIQTEYEFQINSRFIAILPFGIGQYQNDDPLAGTTFLALELLGTAISIFGFLQVEGLRQSDGKFDPINFEQAQVYQNIQLISAYSTLTMMLTGAVHALLTFKEKKQLRKTERQLAPYVP